MLDQIIAFFGEFGAAGELAIMGIFVGALLCVVDFTISFQQALAQFSR